MRWRVTRVFHSPHVCFQVSCSNHFVVRNKRLGDNDGDVNEPSGTSRPALYYQSQYTLYSNSYTGIRTLQKFLQRSEFWWDAKRRWRRLCGVVQHDEVPVGQRRRRKRRAFRQDRHKARLGRHSTFGLMFERSTAGKHTPNNAPPTSCNHAPTEQKKIALGHSNL